MSGNTPSRSPYTSRTKKEWDIQKSHSSWQFRYYLPCFKCCENNNHLTYNAPCNAGYHGHTETKFIIVTTFTYIFKEQLKFRVSIASIYITGTILFVIICHPYIIPCLKNLLHRIYTANYLRVSTNLYIHFHAKQSLLFRNPRTFLFHFHSSLYKLFHIYCILPVKNRC